MEQNLKHHPFAGVGTIGRPTTQNVYLTDGTYNCLIRDVKQRISENPKTRGQMSVILELSIVEVVVDKGEFTTPSGNVSRSNQPGDVVNVFIKMAWGKTAIRLLTEFIAAAAEIGPEEAAQIDDVTWLEFAEKCCYHYGDESEFFDVTDWDEQPLKGKGVKVTATTIRTTNSGNDFTQVKFAAWPREEDN